MIYKHGGRVNCPSRPDLVGSANTATGEVDSDQECTTYSYGFKRQQNPFQLLDHCKIVGCYGGWCQCMYVDIPVLMKKDCWLDVCVSVIKLWDHVSYSCVCVKGSRERLCPCTVWGHSQRVRSRIPQQPCHSAEQFHFFNLFWTFYPEEPWEISGLYKSLS